MLAAEHEMSIGIGAVDCDSSRKPKYCPCIKALSAQNQTAKTMAEEECLFELRAIQRCGNGWWCRKQKEKAYVNCVIGMVCPSFAKALVDGQCVHYGTLDLKKGASDACTMQWELMDKCLQRATDSSQFDLSSLSSRERVV